MTEGTPATRLGFGEAARSKAPSGASPRHSDENATIDLPLMVNVIAAERYLATFCEKFKRITANAKVQISARGQMAAIALMRMEMEVCSHGSEAVRAKTRTLTLAAKQAQIVAIEAQKAGILDEYDQASIGDALTRLALSSRLARCRLSESTCDDARQKRLMPLTH